jgi:hypothetical protein
MEKKYTCSMKLSPEKVLRLVNAIDPRVNEADLSLNYAAWLELKEYATEALHFEIANRKGGKREETRRRTALAFLKRHSDEAKCFSHSWIENGCQVFTDNGSAYRFAEGHHIEGLPQISPEECRVPNTNRFFIQVADTTSEAQINRKDLELATAMWKAEKKEKLPYYPVGPAYYSAEVLLNALKLLGVDEATLRQRDPELCVNTYYEEGDKRRTRCIYHPGHIVLEGREAVIMPAEPPKKEEL